MRSGSASPPSPQTDTQPQLTRADIKNIIPVDLYVGMEQASYLVAALTRGHRTLPPRRVEKFYQTFFMVYHFTSYLISEDLRTEIHTWFKTMPGRFKDTRRVLDGVNLYIRFYNELAEIGIVTLFEGVIQPGFVLDLQDDPADTDFGEI